MYVAHTPEVTESCISQFTSDPLPLHLPSLYEPHLCRTSLTTSYPGLYANCTPNSQDANKLKISVAHKWTIKHNVRAKPLPLLIRSLALNVKMRQAH